MATALFLYSLGVPKETILQDYLATNVYRAEANEIELAKMKQFGLSEEVAQDIMAVKASYLESMFSAVEKEYGTIDLFLEKGLGLDKENVKKLRQQYTK